MEWIALILSIVAIAVVYNLRKAFLFDQKISTVDTEVILNILTEKGLVTAEELKTRQAERWESVNTTPQQRKKKQEALKNFLQFKVDHPEIKKEEWDAIIKKTIDTKRP